MTMYNFLILSVLAPFFSPVIAQGGSSGNCTVFNWDQQPGYVINGTTVRVSAAATCESRQNETYDCPITAIGDQSASYSTNISTILSDASWNTETGTENFLHNLVLNAVNSSLNGASWENSVIGVIDTTQVLPSGTSGYINLTTLERCFEGTMSNCTGGLEDGLAIRACAPVTIPVRGVRTLPFLDGTYTVVEIPQEDVSRYPDPYRGLARGGATGLYSGISRPMMALCLVLTTVCLVL